MARRSQLHQIVPWDGGLNSSVDPGVLPQSDLVRGDNMIFSTSGARKKREGLDYLDALSEIPAVTHRASSGTTRTITFASNLRTSGPTNDRLVVGEKIRITTSLGSGNEVTYYTTTALIASISTNTLTYTGVGSLTETTTATSTITVSRATDVLDIKDYWRTDGSNNKVQRLVSVTNIPQFFFYDSDGRRNFITDSGTAAGGESTQICSAVMNDVLIFAFSRVGDKPKRYRPETHANVQDLGGTPPDFSIMRVHQQRLWTNDKVNKDRLHYSSIANPEEWNGNGDSAYLLIDPGDGDPEGITSIFPSFKGSLFVTKGTKTYEIVGDSPDNYRPIPVSNGLGAVSHKSVDSIDLDDVVYVSRKGFHSLAATASHGDFEGSFLSRSIQPTFNEFSQTRLKFINCAYIPDLNSIAFAVTISSSESANNDLYLYNVLTQKWYRWPDISCQTVSKYQSGSGATKLLIGTNNGRIIEAQNGTHTDFDQSGIDFRIKSGSIYPGNDPVSLKSFKRVSFIFKPVGNFTFTAIIKIDNHEPQALSFSQSSGLDLLGSTFVLGSSVLGTSNVLSTYTLPIDGIGRGCSIEVLQSGTDETVEIYGVIIEYEPADISQETETA